MILFNLSLLISFYIVVLHLHFFIKISIQHAASETIPRFFSALFYYGAGFTGAKAL